MRNLILILGLISFLSYAQVFSDASQICPLGVAVKDILCCNLDGNAYEDILLSPYPSGNLILIMNNESGFSDPITIPWPGNNMRASDFNGDGLEDIATGLEGPLLFSNGDGTFTSSSYDLLSYTVPQDFNEDGMPDILMGSGTDIYLALNRNWGESFETVWSDTIPSWPGSHITGFITGDIAGNSFADFAVLHIYGLRVYVAQDSCTAFSLAEIEDDLHTYSSGSPPYAQCDINNDGHPDLLNTGWDIYPSPPPPIYLSIWENDPGAWYWTQSGINANHLPTVEGCDFNGDGFDEIAYSNSTDVTVIMGTASGPGSVMFSDSDCGCEVIGFGNLAGGANPDLIYSDFNFLYWYQNTLSSLEDDETTVPNLDLSLSQNPFSISVSITSSFQGSFQIFDCTGRLIEVASGNAFEFAPDDLPAGGYILMFTGRGRTVVQKLLYLP